MAHFAKVVDGTVVQVIVAEPEFFDTFVDSTPGQWLKTSYNTIANKHTNGGTPLRGNYAGIGYTNGGTPLRGNYAGIGYTYDAVNDVFYAPQPFASWVLNETTWTWEAPVKMPTDGKPYAWNETTGKWEAIVVPTAE